MRILPSSRRRAVARLVDRQLDTDPTITRRVATIVAAVRQSGDAALLRYAHTGSLTVADSEATGLLVAADQLGFSGLTPSIGAHLVSTLTVSTCLARLELATRHSADALGEASIRHAGEHWAVVAASPAFLALDRDAPRVGVGRAVHRQTQPRRAGQQVDERRLI